jgi:hypothetical protein
MNYGLIKDKILPEHYIFGDLQIVAPPVQPDGQWNAYLPYDELQNIRGIETFACCTFGTLNCLEILNRKLNNRTDNYSDRFLANVSGTETLHGNSPHTVAEYLRKVGSPPEEAWPFSDDIDTYEKYYAPIPQPVSDTAHTFIETYDFLHDWVPNDSTSMMDALRYSPIGMTVDYNGIDENGIWIHRGPSDGDHHWVCCYGYEEGKFWKVFDSYDATHKKVIWDHKPDLIKRYALRTSTYQTQVSFLQRLVTVLQAWLALLKPQKPAYTPPVAPPAPQPAPVLPAPKPDLLEAFCTAIRDFEGGPGDRNYRNNNPGNCRYSSVGYDPSYGVVGRDPQNFAIFKDYATGLRYLTNLVRSKIAAHPDRTITEFFEDYAPSSDGNNPRLYALHVAKQIGVSVEAPMKNLLA